MANKRQIPRAVFEPWDGFVADDLLKVEQLVELVKKETPKAIKEAFENKKTFATLFQINHTEYFLDIPKSYWVDALEECIKYRIEEQRYEDCRDIKKIIDSIKTGSKTLPKKQLKKTSNDGEATNGNPDSNQQPA